jgi:hypothetical protein
MFSGKIKATFEIPDEEAAKDGMRPFIALDTMNLVDAALECGLSNNSPLLKAIHEAGDCLDIQLLLEEHVMEFVPESRSAAAYEVAEWLEDLAKLFRRGGESLKMELKPRYSYPRN